MGSKGPSGNTTTTVQQQNPAANAQLPYLQQLWGGATGLAGQSAPDLLSSQDYARVQAAATTPLAGMVMPNALQQYQNQINAGNPAAGQANALGINAGNAVNTGLWFGQNLAGAANNALAQVPGWQNQFMNAGQQANQTLQGYGSAATNALSGVGNYAMNTLPGMGQSATSALTGLAPGALGGMSSLAGRAATAGNPAEYGLNQTAGMALGGNPAFNSGLQGLASGAYINPATNPADARFVEQAVRDWLAKQE